MNVKSFSYREYETIIAHLRSVNTIMDYSEVKETTDSFCVIRHDVEFSVERALALATFESESLGLHTSYLFQARNNCYNIFSDTNIKILHEIRNMGHHVGLHLHVGLKQPNESYVEYIEKEANFFAMGTGIDIDRFSYHRPPNDVLEQYLEVPGLIDCYSRLFFHYFKNRPEHIRVNYFTDSRHQWQHGHPLNSSGKKVQFLAHPYSWTKNGYENTGNYRSLLDEKYKEIRSSINQETSTFPPELL